jgi:hemoglobin-like flavoprotein
LARGERVHKLHRASLFSESAPLLPSVIVDIAESSHHIQSREEIVTDLFYDIFLDRHPEVREFFVGVNLAHQAAVLRIMLLLIDQHYRRPTPALQQYLKILGYRHGQRKIPAELYPKFRDCLLETLGRFHGTEWSKDLEAEWHAAIDEASRVMLEGYVEIGTY